MLLYSVADQIVFSILKKIDVGFLEISTFSGEVLKFGNPNDKLKVNLQIKTPALNYNFIKGGSIGFAECYMRNEFETNNLSDLISLPLELHSLQKGMTNEEQKIIKEYEKYNIYILWF